MAQNRVRIVDVADALGLSTATVSKLQIQTLNFADPVTFSAHASTVCPNSKLQIWLKIWTPCKMHRNVQKAS